MKLNGKTLSEINTEILVFPRGSGDIVLKFAAVLDLDEFDKLVPDPKPPIITRPKEGTSEPDFADKDYQKKKQERYKKYTTWLSLKTLSATEGLVWDTIDINKPETWDNFENELKSAGFNNSERVRIINTVFEINSLSDDKMEKAKLRFFAQQRQEQAK